MPSEYQLRRVGRAFVARAAMLEAQARGERAWTDARERKGWALLDARLRQAKGALRMTRCNRCGGGQALTGASGQMRCAPGYGCASDERYQKARGKNTLRNRYVRNAKRHNAQARARGRANG